MALKSRPQFAPLEAIFRQSAIRARRFLPSCRRKWNRAAAESPLRTMESSLFGLAIGPPVENLVSSGYQSKLLAKTLVE